MENRTAPTLRFVPDRRYTALAAGGTLVAVVLALLTDDAPGRLMFAVAAAVLAGYVISDLIFSPRLVASPDGLVIRSVLTRATVPWSQVESIEAASRDRLGLRSTTLEIDAGSVLAVFSRRALGADPEQAAGLIRAVRPTPDGFGGP